MPQDEYIVILNFGTGKIDAVHLKDPNADAEEYLQENYQGDLGDCEWMVVSDLSVNFVK